MGAVLDENKKKKLVSSMVSGKLQDVLRAYEEYPETRELRIPRTGDTALHVAASEDWGVFAERMVESAAKSDDVLAIGNKQGDTALHLAAKFGNTYFCKCIAEEDVSLVKAQNESGETPLFSAVSRGKTQAFLYLYHLCKDIPAQPQDQHDMYTRNNGDTILHSAISEEHFDLAYIIIGKCPELVHQPNKDGLSPLHLLATKPSAFPSGVPVFGLRKLAYHCVRVQKLANIPDLAKAPDPQLSWTDFLRPLRASLPSFSIFEHLMPVLPKVFRLWSPELEESTVQDEEAANIQELDQYRNNQQDEETTNGQGYGEIDQEDIEEAANEQVDHMELFQQDETTTNKLQGFLQATALTCALTCSVLVMLLALPIIIAVVVCTTCVLICIMCVPICILCVIWCVLLCYSLVLFLLQVTLLLAKKIFGYEEYARLKHIKERCVWSVEVMTSLIESHHQLGLGMPTKEEHQSLEATVKIVENPMFEAAMNGISEMVSLILDLKPEAIFEGNSEKKNIVMLAVENRQYHLYDDLINHGRINKTVLEQVDKNGNNLLHIAANLEAGKQFWRIRGAALHMHMEIKWYQFVKRSMPPHLVVGYNNEKKTPKEILQLSHRDLMKEGRQWLTDTSQSCSLVAALIATVAFATSAAVPGGLKQDTGVPSLEHKPIFIVSAISSLVALSSSMVSVVMFLGILTSSFKLNDFRTDLPYKLLWGLVSLLISIVSMIISFYAGHCFVLKQEFNQNATLVYEILCSSLLVFIIYKFPLDFDIVWTTIRTRPSK